MLVFDFRVVGNKLHAFRKRLGMTQAEVAEADATVMRAVATKADAMRADATTESAVATAAVVVINSRISRKGEDSCCHIELEHGGLSQKVSSVSH